MKKTIKLISIGFAMAVAQSFALDLNTVFDNQAKSAFPDTCEMQIRTTVILPDQKPQSVDMSVINAGSDKSVTTINSSLIQMKTIQNGTRMKVVDLKSGKTLPAQNIKQQNPADINKKMGSPEDYKNPVKVGSLWKIVPKDASKPTLYYSAAKKRVMKMVLQVNGANAETSFEYCDNTCKLPGTLKKVEINTSLADGNTTKVVLDILEAERRKVLPPKMFDIE